MNKKLEKMKADIENRLKRNIGYIVCTMAFLGAVVTDVIPVQLENEAFCDFVSGFQLGLLIILLAVFLSKIVTYQKALKNEKLLKQLYNKEHDERMNYIDQQVGKSSLSITTVIMVFATIITGYFNFTVFCTMIAVTLLQGIIQIILKWYYTKCVLGDSAEEE